LIYNSGTGWSFGTSANNLQITSGTVFVNRSARDYRIVSTTGSGYPRNFGTNLSSYFNKDAAGNSYGADGTWDIGAYEYSDGTTPPVDTIAPSTPKNVNVL
jgi:hypothetical protein